MDEYHKVKQKLLKGKVAGPDSISPEVFILADIDDIILKIASNLLLNLKRLLNGPVATFSQYQKQET